MKFKLGETLKVVRLGNIGFETQDTVTSNGYKIGDILTVDSIPRGDGLLCNSRPIHSPGWFMHEDHFERLKPGDIRHVVRPCSCAGFGCNACKGTGKIETDTVKENWESVP